MKIQKIRNLIHTNINIAWLDIAMNHTLLKSGMQCIRQIGRPLLHLFWPTTFGPLFMIRFGFQIVIVIKIPIVGIFFSDFCQFRANIHQADLAQPDRGFQLWHLPRQVGLQNLVE